MCGQELFHVQLYNYSIGGDIMKTHAQSEIPESYNTIHDDQLIENAKHGDTLALEFLINKYRGFVRAKARSYFLIGADREDIIQEGMIGLYKAIRDYKKDKLASFRAFAELCITRQIITAIKTATRQKHIPLNFYISLNKPVYEDDSERTLMDMVGEDSICNPELLFIDREAYSGMEEKMGKVLSNLEKVVLDYYLQGKSYVEIAHHLDRHVKSIDNSLQRVKRKLEKCLDANEPKN